MPIFTKTYQTQAQHSAKVMGSGSLEVLATPAIVAFMENAAFSAIENQLPSQSTSVGSAISLEHLAASKVGSPITVKVTKLEVEGRRYDFELEAYDGERLVGRASHTRYQVDIERFLGKLS